MKARVQLERKKHHIAPPVVRSALRSPGRPLDPETRESMEARFGHDFRRVRIHTDGPAAESAAAVGASAYTAGNDIVFGAGWYAPGTAAGRQLLAHELVHTIQQGSTPAETRPAPRFPPVAARTAGARLQRNAGPLKFGQKKTRITIPQRGTNPANCMDAVCERILKWQNAKTDAQFRTQYQVWLDKSLACVRAGAPASNASHHAKILGNNEKELTAEKENTVRDYNAMTKRQRRKFRRGSVETLSKTCRNSAREARIEFHYNVVFENPAGKPAWGFHPSDWSEIEGALAALPAEAAWVNPLLLRFRRETCAPEDVNKAGQCVGHGGEFTAGVASESTGEITIYDKGFGQQPFKRARKLQLPTTFQAIRHEVGHVVMGQVPKNEKDLFFSALLPWKDLSGHWILNPQAYPEWKAVRAEACHLTGVEDSKLNAWLSSMVEKKLINCGKWTCAKYYNTPQKKDYMIRCFQTDRAPKGIEFSYALTKRGEYLAELYAYAVSRPEFLHAALPADQTDWLRRVVFGTPETPEELSSLIALNEPAQTEFLVRGRRMYTWEQLDALIKEVVTQPLHPGSKQI